MVKAHFSKRVKVVRNDNSNQFKSRPMKSFYREKGITHETSCEDTPQQNGRAERKH